MTPCHCSSISLLTLIESIDTRKPHCIACSELFHHFFNINCFGPTSITSVSHFNFDLLLKNTSSQIFPIPIPIPISIAIFCHLHLHRDVISAIPIPIVPTYLQHEYCVEELVNLRYATSVHDVQCCQWCRP